VESVDKTTVSIWRWNSTEAEVSSANLYAF